MSSKPPVSRAEHQEHREDDTGDVGTAEVKGSGSLPQPGSARSSRHQAYGTARQNLDGIILLSEQKLERENRWVTRLLLVTNSPPSLPFP